METSSQWLLTVLLNSLWLVAGIGVVALVCEKLLRGTAARFRHRLWVAALAASFCLPILVSTRIPFDFQFSHPKKLDVAGYDPRSSQAAPVVLDSLAPTSFRSLDLSAPLEKPSGLQVGRNVAVILVTAYMLFVLFKLGGLLVAWARTRTLVRTAYSTELPAPVQTVVKRCESVLGLSQVRVHFSPAVAVPIAAGVFRPLVILPEEMLGETAAAILTSAIGHELVHVRRRDFTLNLFYEFISLPLSFHPAAALIRRHIRQTRELRCDEIVAEQLMEPGAYARSLVELAGFAVPLGHTMRTISVGINDADILEERVMNMLRRPKISIRRRNLMVIAAALLFVVPCVVAAPFALHLTVTHDAIAARQEGGQSASQEERQKQEARARKEKEEAEAKFKSIAAPRAISSPPAEYTEDARTKKIEGIVVLMVKIGPDGLVKGVEVKKSLYPSLDESALRTVRTWRFEPVMKDGKAVEAQAHIELSFQLYHGGTYVYRSNELRTKKERIEQERSAEQMEKESMELLAKLQQVERELEQLKKDGNKESAERERELVEQTRKQLNELEKLRENGLVNSEREARVKQERGQLELKKQQLGWAIASKDEGRARKQRDEEIAKRREELATRVRISMAQAIEAALSEQKGMVVECVLDGQGDQIFYRVRLQVERNMTVSREGEPSVTTHTHMIHTVLISAVDGHMMKHEHNEP
jgi:TonB family protein